MHTVARPVRQDHGHRVDFRPLRARQHRGATVESLDGNRPSDERGHEAAFDAARYGGVVGEHDDAHVIERAVPVWREESNRAQENQFLERCTLGRRGGSFFAFAPIQDRRISTAPKMGRPDPHFDVVDSMV
jgi:hypothetical protein